jgi:hypothetical protein
MNTKTRKQGSTIAILMLFLFGNYAMTQNLEVDKDSERILMNYVSAIGGEKALGEIKNIVSKSDLLVVEAGVIINREIVQDKTNNIHIKAYSPQTGEIFRGFDGNNYWEKNRSSVSVFNDERILSFLNEFAFMRFAEWKKTLLDAKYIGIESIDGKEFHTIAATTIYGVKEKWYFNKTDFLLSYMEEQLEMTSGVVPVITKFDDYREVDGVKHSFTQSIKMGRSNRKITYNSILHNQKIDYKIFSKPSSN